MANGNPIAGPLGILGILSGDAATDQAFGPSTDPFQVSGLNAQPDFNEVEAERIPLFAQILAGLSGALNAKASAINPNVQRQDPLGQLQRLQEFRRREKQQRADRTAEREAGTTREKARLEQRRREGDQRQLQRQREIQEGRDFARETSAEERKQTIEDRAIDIGFQAGLTPGVNVSDLDLTTPEGIQEAGRRIGARRKELEDIGKTDPNANDESLRTAQEMEALILGDGSEANPGLDAQLSALSGEELARAIDLVRRRNEFSLLRPLTQTGRRQIEGMVTSIDEILAKHEPRTKEPDTPPPPTSNALQQLGVGSFEELESALGGGNRFAEFLGGLLPNFGTGGAINRAFPQPPPPGAITAEDIAELQRRNQSQDRSSRRPVVASKF